MRNLQNCADVFKRMIGSYVQIIINEANNIRKFSGILKSVDNYYAYVEGNYTSSCINLSNVVSIKKRLSNDETVKTNL